MLAGKTGDLAARLIDDMPRNTDRGAVLSESLETRRAADPLDEVASFGVERNVVIRGGLLLAGCIALSVGRDIDRLAEEVVVRKVAHEVGVGVARIDAVALKDPVVLRGRGGRTHGRLVYAAEVHIDIAARIGRSVGRGIDDMGPEPERVAGHVIGFVRMEEDLLLRKKLQLAAKTQGQRVGCR